MSSKPNEPMSNVAPTGAVEITNVAFSPAALNPGDLLSVSITVFNGSAETLATQGPDPGFAYEEGDTFRSRGFTDTNGAFRVGVDFDGRTGIDHPYRWGLGAPLAPGQSAIITGTVRLRTPRTLRYWAGLVREQIAWLQDRQGEQVIALNAPGAINITNVAITPPTLNAGAMLNVSITVRNDSSVTLPTQEPDPGFVYSEGDTFRSRGFTETIGNFRVGIDFDGRSGVDHPYRWGLGAPLAPGQSATITGAIQLNTAGTRKYWAGLVREQIAWLQDGQGAQAITVNAGSVTITNVTLAPTALSANGLLNVSIAVRNDSPNTLPTQGPYPGFVYDEGDTFHSRGFTEALGNYRVGIDFEGRTGVDHPYRWGLGAPLAPGQSAIITGTIRLRTPRAVKYWAGLVSELVAWVQDQQGEQTITVNPASITITDAILMPVAISAGSLLNVSITVRNDSGEMLQTQEPDPGFVYNEGDTFRSRGFTETLDSFRVGVDFEGRTGIDHPYRWGLGAPLAPGQTVTITGAIRLQTARAANYWGGLVREQVLWVQDQQGTQKITVTPAPVLSFDATPALVEVGGAATLQWTATDARSVSLDGEIVLSTGSRVVSPTQTTTYNLHVVLGDGSVRDLAASVTVVPKKIASFTATPNTLLPGDTATLNWNTQDATQVALNGESVALSGSRIVTPTQTTAYTLRVIFSDGLEKNLSVTVTVEQYGLAAMLQFEQLPFLRLNTQAGGQSSYDRTGGNADWNNFLSIDSSGAGVLCDLRGVGTVYRVWATGFDENTGRIQIYFDGEAAPRVDMLMRDFFVGTNAPFLTPLVGDAGVSSGGYYCYVPMSFSSSVRITASGISGINFYYNVGYHLYTPDTSVRTFTTSEDNSAVRALWNRAGQDPKSDAGNTTATGAINLGGGSAQTIFDIAGPRSLSAIRLKIPGVVARVASEVWDILNGVWIRIYWDGETNPSIAAPLGSFFAIGQFSTFRTRSLAAGIDDANTLYIYFPMPFERHARIELFNNRSVATNGIAFEIKHKPFDAPFAQVGYFKTQFNDQIHSQNDGTDVTLLDTNGTGHLVGVVLSIRGEANRVFLEGDERIYIDDSRTPAFQGTGTEDFFNGGWYFRGGTFSLPVHGNTSDIRDASFERIAMYRLFLAEAIPFTRHLTVGIEHGPVNDVNEEAWTLAYYYHKPSFRAILTDTLDVGNAASEQTHAYAIVNPTWSGERSQPYEGVFGNASIGDTGRAHKGYSQFAVAIQPANTGVILRRRLDYGVANQNADVFVDGVRVGAWFSAGGNFGRWRDDEFMIPAAFTRGKNSLLIRVAFVSSNVDWNEFNYSVYSLT